MFVIKFILICVRASFIITSVVHSFILHAYFLQPSECRNCVYSFSWPFIYVWSNNKCSGLYRQTQYTHARYFEEAPWNNSVHEALVFTLSIHFRAIYCILFGHYYWCWSKVNPIKLLKYFGPVEKKLFLDKRDQKNTLKWLSE